MASSRLARATGESGPMPSVFVSYRRDDTRHAIGRLGEQLDDHVRLLMDGPDIAPSADFTVAVQYAVAQADVLVAVIGNSWLTIADADARRIDQPYDWVALEIAAALRTGIPVIPVLLDGARMPTRGELPEALADLANRQALTLHHESWAADCTRLTRVIDALTR